MFIPIKIDNAKLNVSIRWLVIVKLYGTRPITLAINTNKKTVNITGKYFCPRGPILSTSIAKTVSYKVSNKNCHLDGTICKLPSTFDTIVSNKLKKNKPQQIIIVPFEIEKSNEPIRNKHTGII
jgi:hypothetical protein